MEQFLKHDTRRSKKEKEKIQKKVDLDLLFVVLHSSGVLGQAHLGGKGGVRLPLGGSAGSRLLHHAVDLLEGQTLGLGNKQVSVDEGGRAESSPNCKIQVRGSEM